MLVKIIFNNYYYYYTRNKMSKLNNLHKQIMLNQTTYKYLLLITNTNNVHIIVIIVKISQTLDSTMPWTKSYLMTFFYSFKILMLFTVKIFGMSKKKKFFNIFMHSFLYKLVVKWTPYFE